MSRAGVSGHLQARLLCRPFDCSTLWDTSWRTRPQWWTSDRWAEGLGADSYGDGGGNARADELCYDPNNAVILIASDADTPPFITFISSINHAILGGT
jgi:hypothetical protein